MLGQPALIFHLLALIGAYITVFWLISLLVRNSAIMDIGWGLGFVLVTAYAYYYEAVNIPRQMLHVLMVALWGLRLTLHIGYRNWGLPEDWRYAKWRAAHPDTWWWRSYLKVFLLQGMVMAVVMLPLMAVQYAPVPDQWTLWDSVGVALWVIGFGFEAIGDYQLLRFRKYRRSEDDVLETGLWRFTRHPNYFGETALWWGFGVMAAGVGAWWTLISPVLMTYLLLRVSGVAMLEKGLQDRKPAYVAYIRRTPAFFPWFPQKDA